MQRTLARLTRRGTRVWEISGRIEESRSHIEFQTRSASPRRGWLSYISANFAS